MTDREELEQDALSACPEHLTYELRDQIKDLPSSELYKLIKRYGNPEHLHHWRVTAVQHYDVCYYGTMDTTQYTRCLCVCEECGKFQIKDIVGTWDVAHFHAEANS